MKRRLDREEQAHGQHSISGQIEVMEGIELSLAAEYEVQEQVKSAARPQLGRGQWHQD
jgi:hypothetical protein